MGDKREFTFKFNVDTSALESAFSKLEAGFSKTNSKISKELKESLTDALSSVYSQYGRDGKLPETVLGKMLGKDNMSTLSAFYKGDSSVIKTAGQLNQLLSELNKVKAVGDTISQTIPSKYLSLLGNLNGNQLNSILKKVGSASKKLTYTDKEWQNEYRYNEGDYWEKQEKKIKSYVTPLDLISSVKKTKSATWYHKQADNMEDINRYGELFGIEKGKNGKYSKEQISELNDYSNAIRGIQDLQSNLKIVTFKSNGKSKINLNGVNDNDLADVATSVNQILQLQNIVKNFEDTYGKNVSSENLFAKSSDFLKFDFDGKNIADIVKNEFLTRATNAHFAENKKQGMNELKRLIPQDIQAYYDTNVSRKASADVNEKVNTARQNAKRSIETVKANAENEKQTAINASSEELTQLEKEVATKQAELAELKKQVEESHDKISQQQYEDLSDTVEEQKETIRNLQKQLNDNGNVKELEDNYKAASEERDELRAENADLNSQLAEVTSQLAEAQKNKGTATDDEYNSAVRESSRLKAENQILESENADLQSSLAQVHQELVDRIKYDEEMKGSSKSTNVSSAANGGAVASSSAQELENFQKIKDAVNEIVKAAKDKTTEFNNEDEAVANISQNEVTNLGKIGDKINSDIIPAIENKTTAFRDEGDIVKSVVSQEVSDLNQIEKALDNIRAKAKIDITINNNGNIPNGNGNGGGNGGSGSKNKNITAARNAYQNYKYLLSETFKNLDNEYTDKDYLRAANLIKNMRGFQGNSKFSSFATPKENSVLDTAEARLAEIYKNNKNSVRSNTYNAAVDRYKNATEALNAKRTERLDYLDNNAPDQKSLAMWKEMQQLEQERIAAYQEILNLKNQIVNADEIDKKFIEDATNAENAYKQAVQNVNDRAVTTKNVNTFWDTNRLSRGGINQTYGSTQTYLNDSIGALSSMMSTAYKSDDYGKSDYSTLANELSIIDNLVKAIQHDNTLKDIVDDKVLSKVEKLHDELTKIQSAVSKNEYASFDDMIDDYKKLMKTGNYQDAKDKKSDIDKKRNLIGKEFRDADLSADIDKRINSIDEQINSEVETLQLNLTKRFDTLFGNQGSLMNLLFKEGQGEATSNQKSAITRNGKKLADLFDDLNNKRLGNDTGKIIDESGQLVNALDAFNNGLVNATRNLEDVANSKVNDILDSFISEYNLNDRGIITVNELRSKASNIAFIDPIYGKDGSITNLPDVLKSISNYKSNILEPAKTLRNNKTLRYADVNSATELASNWASWKQRNHASVLNNVEAQNIDASISNIGNLSESQFDVLSSQIDKFEAKMNDINKVGKTFFDNVEDGIRNFGTQLLTFFSTQNLFNEIRNGVQYTTQYNSALIEMKKVSSDTDSAINQFAKDAGSMANEIGSTSITIQNSAADWMRLGYSIKDATELAKNTSILMNVSEFDSISAATESMVAMVQAFKAADQDAGDLSLEIIDKLNNIGNNYSISTSELAESLQRSSGALIAAGNDINGAVALTTAGNAQIQDPDSVGNAMKTISMRLRGTSVADIGGEDEITGMVTTASKLKDQIQSLTKVNGSLGVSIVDINGNYKDTYTILQEISDVWEDIGKQDKIDGQNRQAALLEDIAGKTRASVLASVLQNPDMLRNVYEDAQNSEGSALKENETYMESIVAHQEQLKNAYQEIWNSDSYTNVINGFLSLGTNILNVTKNVGLLKTALVGLASLKGFKDSQQGVGIFKIGYDNNGDATLPQFNKNENFIASIFNYVKNGIGDNKKYENDENANKKYAAQFENFTKDALKQYSIGSVGTREEKEAASFFSQFEIGERNVDSLTHHFKELNVNIGKFTAKTIAAKAAEVALNVATEALTTALISLAVQALASGIDYIINYEKNLAEKADEAQQKISELNNIYKESSDYVSENADKYDQLSKGVNDLGENVSLSSDSYKEFLEINNKLAELFPSLDRIYDADGNAIIQLGNSAKSTSNQLEELLEAKQKYYNKEIVNQAPDILKNAAYTIDKNSSKSDKYKEQKEAAEELIEKIYSEENPIQKLLDGGQLKGLTKQEADEYAAILKEQWGIRSSIDASSNGFSISTLFSGVNKRQNAAKEYKENEKYYLESLSGILNANASKYSTEKDEIDSATAEINNQIKQIANAWLETNPTYTGFKSDVKKVAKTFFNNIDYSEYFKNGTLNENSDISTFLRSNFLDAFRDTDIQSDLIKLSENGKGLSDGTTSIKEYATAYNDLIKKAEKKLGVDSEVYKQFEKTYGSSSVKQLKNYNSLISRVGTENVKNLKQADLAIISNTDNVGELYAKLQAISGLSPSDTLDKLVNSLKNIDVSSNIDSAITNLIEMQKGLTDGTSSLYNAFSNQNSSGFLTNTQLKTVSAQLQKLGITEEDLGKALEFTGNGMQLNTDKLSAMVKVKAYEQVAKLNDQYRELDKIYTQQQNDLEALTRSKNANTDAVKNAIAAKREELDKTYEQMSSLNKLKAEFEEYTDVYTKFQNALSTANQGARYDNMRSQKDTIDKLAKYGQFGVDEVEAYTEYYTGTDTANMNFADSAKWYQTAASKAKKYNTESIAGIQALMKDIQGTGAAHTDEGGELVIDNIKEAANEAGVSVSFLVDAINKLKEYKIDVQYDQNQFDSASKEVLTQTKHDLEEELQDLQTKLLMQEAQGATEEAKSSTQALIDALQQQVEECDIQIKFDSNSSEIYSQVVEIENKIKDLMKDTSENSSNKAINDSLIAGYQQQIDRMDSSNPELHIRTVVDGDLNAYQQSLDSAKTTTEETSNAAQAIVDTLNGGADFNVGGNGVQSLLTMKNSITALEEKNHVVNVEIRKKFVDAKSADTGGTSISDSASADSQDGPNSVDGGIARADGTLNELQSGKTLVGELGQELVVDRSTGTWRTVGDNGAEFTNIDKGDIVFDANQTKALLSSGSIGSRGKALAGGQNNYNMSVIDDLVNEAHEKQWPGTKNLTREQLIDAIDQCVFGNINMQTRQIFTGDGYYQTVEGAWATIGNKAITYSPFNQSGTDLGVADKLEEDTIFWYLDQIVNSSDNSNSEILRLDRIGITDDNGYHISHLISGVFDASDEANADFNSEITHFVGEYYDRMGMNHYYNDYKGKARANGQNTDLVGELGPEIRVHDGKWDVVGQNGAELTNIAPNDIVIPADETRKILSGNSYANGQAYVEQSRSTANYSGAYLPTSSASISASTMAEVAAYQKKQGVYTEKNTKAVKKNTKATEDETKQTYNWIETLVNNIEHKRDITSELETSEWNSYSSRISGYRKMIEYDKQLTDVYSEALKKYSAEVDEKYEAIKTAFGSDTETAEQYINLIKNGSLGDDWKTKLVQEKAGDNATDEEKKAIEKKYTKQTTAISEAQEWLNNLYDAETNQVKWMKQQHEDLKSIYDLQLEQNKALIEAIDSQISELQTNIELKNTVGDIVTTGDYEDLIAATDDKISQYYNQIDILENQLAELDDDVDSQEYQEIQASIAEANAAILDCQKSQAEWNETIKELPVTHIESYIENIKTAQSDLNDYIAELEAAGKKVTSDIIKQQMEVEQLLAKQYQNEIAKVEKNLNTYTAGKSLPVNSYIG